MADALDPMRLYGCLTVYVSPMIYKGGPGQGTIPAIPAYIYLDSWFRVTVPPAEHFQLGHVLIPRMWRDQHALGIPFFHNHRSAMKKGEG